MRKAWKKYCRDNEMAAKECAKRGYIGPANLSPFPEECRGMNCGARTRAGTPCKQKGICDNGRYKLHGGLSTGPKTPKGKRKSSLNWKKRKIFSQQQQTP